jgi:VWFA-related protein
MKRPGDRVAIIAFEDKQKVVSELEADKDVLLKKLKDIEGYGGSRVWDAVKFGVDMLEGKSEKGRRKAIVLMSDGVDNLLSFQQMLVPRMGFADLVETVQRSSVAIFPIYLDTEGGDAFSKQVYANARLTLSYLAEQSAGNMYTARKIDDLSDIYDRVLKDVGTVYSLGFTPDVQLGDDRWRKLRVEIPAKPTLKIKHRPGYFTR